VKVSIPISLLERLACPLCGSRLEESESLVCAGCGAEFRIADQIPLLAPDTESPEKRAQAAFYDAYEDDLHETMRPWDRPRFHAWLLDEKFRLATAPIARLLQAQSSALVVCGGAGLDAELLSRFGCEVVTSDISAGASRRALDRARRRETTYLAIVADAEHLPFRDRSMDLVYVHDGLHHLPDPGAGVREMLRVARVAIAITEPTPSLMTQMAVRARVADDVEEAGNLVKRVPLSEFEELARDAGFTIARSRKYGTFYRDGTGLVTRALSARGVFPIAQALMRAAMRLSAPVGNKLVLVATRPDAG
jgi:SAM-dependent methyltransferase/DNA-directed RNA polymerase subunit RPC12/RpoP